MYSIITKWKVYIKQIYCTGYKFQYRVIAIMALVDSFISILPTEILISTYSLNSKISKVFKMAALAALASLIGATSIFLLAVYFSESILTIMNNWGINIGQEEILAFFGNKGVWFSIFVGTFTPFFPSVAIFFLAGSLEVNIFMFLVLVFISRFCRLTIFGSGVHIYDVLVLRQIKNIYIKTFLFLVFFVSLVFLFTSIKI